MASPFYVFRKYQRAFIAIAAVVAMFIFVVADPLMTWLQQANGGGGAARANTVVATWDGGSLNLQQLTHLAQRRVAISNFLEVMYRRAALQVEQEGGTPARPSLPNFIIDTQDFKTVQANCVSTRVLAELAEKSGITIDDEFINQYLSEWGLRRTGDAEIAAILNRFGLSDKMLFAGLRELLLGNFYINSYSLAIQGSLPQERWHDWKRINEMIKVEAAVLPVDDFVASVPEPSEAELQQFFEENKEREPVTYQLTSGKWLRSASPGFREPRRVKLQYLVGSLDDWSQEALESVSEGEIADYYERNKRTQFVKTATTTVDGLFDDEPEDESSDESEADSTDGTETATPGTEASTVESTEESTEETAAEMTEESAEEATEEDADSEATEAESSATTEESASEESSDESTEEAGEESSAEETAEEESAAEQSEESSEEQPAEEESADEESAEDETGNLNRPSPFRLASFQAEEESSEENDEEASEESEESTSEESADESAAQEEGADEPSTDSDESSTEPEEEELSFVPLAEVHAQIRRSLARDKAVLELQKVMGQTFTSLQTAYNPYGLKVVTARSEEKEIPAPPEKLADFKAIASKTGLISEETALLSYQQLSETNVGKALDAQSRMQSGTLQNMFGEHELYEPYRAIEMDGSNQYIVSKVEDIPSRVPEFEDVRGEVLTAWKKKEAAKLALEKAEEIATQAEKDGNTVADAVEGKDYKVEETDMFSWLTFGITQSEFQRGPRLGEAPPLESVGLDFMTKAFELEPGQTAAILNHDHTQAYVFQLKERAQTKEELRKQFLAEANIWFGRGMMNYVRGDAAQRKILSELTQQVGLNLDKLQELLAPEDQ